MEFARFYLRTFPLVGKGEERESQAASFLLSRDGSSRFGGMAREIWLDGREEGLKILI